MITVKNKTSIKIRLQTATLTLQQAYHQQIADLKPPQSIRNTITRSTKTRLLTHHQSKVETLARIQIVKDISQAIKTSIQRMDQISKHQGL